MDRIKIIFLIGFIFLNLLVYFITEVNKQQRTEKALNNELKQLQTDYETLMHHQKINTDIIVKNIRLLSKDVINQIDLDLTKEELSLLRKQLYKNLYKRYQMIKSRGVFQIHFVLPDNTSFLRMHKPDKFGDSLKGIRYSYEFVNKNKKYIEGFEGGKTVGSYRYIYPIFNDKGEYVFALDISYSTHFLQNYLTTVSKQHTHFLVKKETFSNMVWTENTLDEKFIQASEHNGYMLQLTQEHTVKNCVDNNKVKLHDYLDQINTKMKSGKPFAFYAIHPSLDNETHEHNMFIKAEIISFYPIHSPKGSINAWLVSYNKSDFIESTIEASIIVRVIALFVILILLYLFYINLKQKEEFKAIFEYSKDGIAILDLESRFLDFNDAYLKMLGYSTNELLQKTCIELTAPEEKEKSIEALKIGLEQGYLENYEKTCISKDGKRVTINMTATLLPDKKRFLIVTKDITSLKTIEKQAKLASMGEMIGNIAHQWRQPLTVITTNASGIRLKQELEGKLDNAYIHDTTNIIVEQANYLSKTIDNFRDFIRGDNKYTKTSIMQAIEKSLNLVAVSLNKNFITVIQDTKDDLIIYGNIYELEQAFINLMNNTKDVLISNVPNEEDRLFFISTKKIDTNSIELIFKDTGGGIQEDIISRIFEPYFTTKHQSQGTGLGLSMVDKILRERHKAHISAYNEEFEYNGKKYKGACFKIIFKSAEK